MTLFIEYMIVMENVDPKIESLKQLVVGSFEYKLNDLLSICDSPIEKLMMLHFINFFNYSKPHYQTYIVESSFQNCHFLTDTISSLFPEDWEKGRRFQDEEGKKSPYEPTTSYEKVVGYKASLGLPEGIQNDGSEYSGPEKSISRTFRIYPNWPVTIDNKPYRIDIAIFMDRVLDNTIIDTRKIGIECDGRQFHSSNEQINKDRLRTEILSSEGWRIKRLTGAEINRISISGFEKFFFELLKEFYT